MIWCHDVFNSIFKSLSLSTKFVYFKVKDAAFIYRNLNWEYVFRSEF